MGRLCAARAERVAAMAPSDQGTEQRQWWKGERKREEEECWPQVSRCSWCPCRREEQQTALPAAGSSHHPPSSSTRLTMTGEIRSLY